METKPVNQCPRCKEDYNPPKMIPINKMMYFCKSCDIMVANPNFDKNYKEVKMTESSSAEVVPEVSDEFEKLPEEETSEETPEEISEPVSKGKDNRPVLQVRLENAKKVIEFANSLTDRPKEPQKIINKAYKICLGEQ